MAELDEISDLHLLTVKLDRLTRWHRPGLLAIGDAAHAMSPIGGIGINLAIQDAVAAANILAAPLARGENVDALLAKVAAAPAVPDPRHPGRAEDAQDRVIGRLLEPGPPTDPGAANRPVVRPLSRGCGAFPAVSSASASGASACGRPAAAPIRR